MKIQFTYNVPELSQALTIAKQTAEFADILGVGSLLIIKEGVRAIEAFKKEFPSKQIASEIRITEKADAAVALMASAGANIVTILGSTFTTTIKKAVDSAKRFGVSVGMDLIDAASLGQSAMDAKTLGVDFLIFHQDGDTEKTSSPVDVWADIKDNSNLPIFVTGKINQENIQEILAFKPSGIMIGAAITKAENPAKAAHFFRSQI